jgi:hypothetical protein
MKPITEDRGYYNVLLAQEYRTPRGAVIEEYGAGSKFLNVIYVNFVLKGLRRAGKDAGPFRPLC